MVTTEATERLIPFAEVPSLPWMRRRGSKKLSYVTLWRWREKGIKHPRSDQRVRLEAIRVGGQWCTTETNLRRFFEALSSELPAQPAQRTISERELDDRTKAARNVLERQGVNIRRKFLPDN